MKTLEEYDIVKDRSDHESAKKYFLDLTKKYFDGKTPIEGNWYFHADTAKPISKRYKNPYWN